VLLGAGLLVFGVTRGTERALAHHGAVGRRIPGSATAWTDVIRDAGNALSAPGP